MTKASDIHRFVPQGLKTYTEPGVLEEKEAPDRIVSVDILYERAERIVIGEETAESFSAVIASCNEQILIDRKKGTLEIRQQLGSRGTARTEYYDREGVAALLDELNEEGLFARIKGNDPDAIPDPDETKSYAITVSFAARPSIVLRGTFDRNGLPEDYPEAAVKILSFVIQYASIESLSPYLYLKRPRTVGDHIYCSVEFEEDGRSYYYRTDDETLAVGDYVVVPVGREDRSAVVRIVAIDYYSEEEVPFPLDKVKKVTKRYIKERDTDMQKQNAQLLAAMIRYDRGDAMRIQHLIKVHGYAAAIGRLEDLDEETQFILEAAAILHDVGIHVSLEKYGSSAGKYQELEGPAEAEMLMRQVGGYTGAQIERVKYLVGHHHTYSDIEGQDYQILVEADFLVNLDENASECEAAQSVSDKYFKTETGKRMLADIFLQGGSK